LTATTNRLVLWEQTQPRTANDGDDPFAPTDADGMGRPGMGGKIVGHVLLPLLQAHLLIAADLRNDLHPTEHRRGAIDKRSL
jgi:hypothetical protein